MRAPSACVLAAWLVSYRAMATPPLQLEARELDYDPTTHELVLRGEVRIGTPPFVLTSPCLHLRETPLGWVVQGQGRLSL